MSGLISIFGTAVFLWFGSAEVQPWNDLDQSQTEEQMLEICESYDSQNNRVKPVTYDECKRE